MELELKVILILKENAIASERYKDLIFDLVVNNPYAVKDDITCYGPMHTVLKIYSDIPILSGSAIAEYINDNYGNIVERAVTL